MDISHVEPSELRQLINECLNFNPSRRPSAKQVEKRLKKISDSQGFQGSQGSQGIGNEEMLANILTRTGEIVSQVKDNAKKTEELSTNIKETLIQTVEIG